MPSSTDPLLTVRVIIEMDYRLAVAECDQLVHEISDALIPVSNRYPAIDFTVVHDH